MSRQPKQILIAELSKLYNQPIKVVNLLEDIGVRAHTVPAPFGNLSPYDYWRELVRTLEGGLVEDSIAKLTKAILSDYPHNTALKTLHITASIDPLPAVKTKDTPIAFDVFLAYNSKNVTTVQYVAQSLKAEGLEPWFDQWYLEPGKQVYLSVEEALVKSAAIACFMGPQGKGNWQSLEIGTALELFVQSGKPLIPIWLQGSKMEDTPLFLRQYKGYVLSSSSDDAMITKIIAYLKARQG